MRASHHGEVSTVDVKTMTTKKDVIAQITAMVLLIGTTVSRMTTAVSQPAGRIANEVASMVFHFNLGIENGWLHIVAGNKGSKGQLGETTLQIAYESPVDGVNRVTLVPQVTEFIGGAIRVVHHKEGHILPWATIKGTVGDLLSTLDSKFLTPTQRGDMQGDNLLARLLKGAITSKISPIAGLERYKPVMARTQQMDDFHNVAISKAPDEYGALSSWDDINLGSMANKKHEMYEALQGVSLADWLSTLDMSKHQVKIGASGQLADLTDDDDFFGLLG